MRKTPATIVSAVFCVVSAAAVAAGITFGVDPLAGPTTGGVVVNLYFDQPTLDSLCPSTCEDVIVLFGGISALRVVRSGPGTLSVLTPTSPAGLVDVSVEKRNVVVARNVEVYEYFVEQPPRGAYQKVLIPVVFEILDGAFGSKWTWELIANTTADAVVDQYPDFTCPLGGICGRPAQAIANTRFTPAISYRRDGSLVYYNVPEEAIAFNLRVQDISRANQTWGTEVPVVRLRDTAPRIELLNIPIDPRFRNRLRIYDLDGIAGTPVNLSLYDDRTGALLAVRALRLGDTQRAVLTGRPLNASEADLGPFDVVPEVLSHDRVRIVITGDPSDNAQHLWAFVSVTHNETQFVTTITPH